MILLDTHILLWQQTDARKLSRAAQSAIRRARHPSELAISAITLVEIANLLRRGRLRIQGTVQGTLERYSAGISLLPITADVAALTYHFPDDFPSDPADRIIAATACAEGIPLVTADERILNCPLVETIW